MKITTKPKTKSTSDELRPEYEIDYSKTKPNRFAKYFKQDSVAVALDPDVAAVFNSTESVNTALRALLQVVPGRKSSKVVGYRGASSRRSAAMKKRRFSSSR